MRPIDADALKKSLLEKGFYPAIVKRVIEDAPVVDAVEVVRCKDCEHYHEDTHSLCDYHAASVCPEWFCWNGERRGEEDGESKLD